MPERALVLTDLERSTRMWAEQPDAMATAMARHHRIVHDAIERFGGRRPPDQGEGDAVFAAFDTVSAALHAVIAFQQELAAEPWPDGIRMRDRVAVHFGEVLERDGNLFGTTVNRTARVRGLAAGGQVLVSGPAYDAVRDDLPADWTVLDLGERRVKDVDQPERLFQVSAAGLATDFPPIAGIDNTAHDLPVPGTSFVGREREVRRLGELIDGHRLVTVLGFGGMGKTRLATWVADGRTTGFEDGVWFVDLAPLRDVAQIPLAIARTLGIGVGAGDPLEAVIDGLSPKRSLLVLDNLEQLLPDAAEVVDAILTGAPGVKLLVTSRRPIRLRAEQVLPLETLEAPPGPTDLERLATYGAVRLLVSRIRAVRPDFTLNAATAPAVAAICIRVNGLPLALELAAARTRALPLEAIAARLNSALRILKGGGTDLPDRHRAMEATIRWSVDDLGPAERELLGRLSVFPGSFDLAAAEAVGGSEDQDALDGLESLVDRSLVRLLDADAGRYDLLVPIREFAGGLLDDAAAVEQHAAHYRDRVVLSGSFTQADLLRRNSAVIADWHNVRAAFQHFHDGGEIPDEVGIAASVGRALRDEGRYGDARDVMTLAIADLPQRGDWPHQVLLLVDMGRLELSSQRMDIARPWGLKSVAAARRLGDSSLLALALCRAAILAEDRDEFEVLYAECEAEVAALGDSDVALPNWYVMNAFSEAAINMSFLDLDRMESIQAQRARDAPPETRAKEELGHAYVLTMLRRFEDVVELLARYEIEGGGHDAPASVQLEGVLYAAEARIALGDWWVARADIDLGRARLAVIDMPGQGERLTMASAAVERRLGDEARAIRILRELLASSTDPARQADALYLLAVMERAAGRYVEAAVALEGAWVRSIDPLADAEERVAQCLLERAVSVEASCPETALLLVAAERADPPRWPDFSGVDYDVDALLGRIRGRLGAGRVEALLARPLPSRDELWERSQACLTDQEKGRRSEVSG